MSTVSGGQGCDSLLNSVAEASHWGEDDWDNMEVVIDKGDPTRVGLNLEIQGLVESFSQKCLQSPVRAGRGAAQHERAHLRL